MNGEHRREWFERVFWPAYPKRVGKAQALAELDRLRPDEATLSLIENGLQHILAAERYAKSKSAFFPAWPDPHRWLRKRRWQDRHEVPRETGGVPRCHCGAVGVVGDGRRWYCSAHDPDRRPA